jgi:hypothetical protein
MSFDDLIKLSPQLNHVYTTLGYNDKKKWIRKLKTRMYREGLLGKNMV